MPNPIQQRLFRVTVAFSPLDIAGLQLWLDASDAPTLFQDAAKTTPATLDGDVIGAWADKSGNGNDATQATTANKPILKLAIQNGKPVVRFDGVDDRMTHPYSRGGNPCTVFAVAKRNAGIGGWQTIIQAAANNTPLSAMIDGRTNASANWGVYFNADLSSSYSIDGLWRIMASVVRSGTDIDVVTNGIVETVVGLGYYAGDESGRQAIGSLISSETFTGDIAEILVYDSALSTANRQAVENYLNSHWSIY